MSKLTPKQNAANKARNKIRGQLHTARYNAMRAELYAAEEATLIGKHPEYSAAIEARDKLYDERDAIFADIIAQIVALQSRRREIETRYDPWITRARVKCDAAWKLWNAWRQAAVAEVEARYPEMEGHSRYSAAAWGETSVGKGMIEKMAK
jgi:hypothetical protein